MVRETDVFTPGADGYHTFRIMALVVANDRHSPRFLRGPEAGRVALGDVDLDQVKLGAGHKVKMSGITNPRGGLPT